MLSSGSSVGNVGYPCRKCHIIYGVIQQAVDCCAVSKFAGTEMERLVRSYLASRHTAIWGQAFDIIAPDGNERAVQWLTEVIGEVVAQ